MNDFPFDNLNSLPISISETVNDITSSYFFKAFTNSTSEKVDALGRIICVLNTFKISSGMIENYPIIKHLINEAIKLNVKKLSLETGAGEFFLPARKLFIKCGFEVCEPFSHYKEDINSVYMSLLIGNKS